MRAKKSLLLALGLLGPIAALTSSSANATAIVWSGNGHSYEYVYAPGASWLDAMETAQKRGGNLVTLTSAAEEQFVLTEVVGKLFSTMIGEVWYNTAVWAGAQLSLETNEWNWVTGETLDYTNWTPGEPNNYNGAEYYLAFNWKNVGFKGAKAWDGWNGYNFERQWNDESLKSGNVQGFVVEWNRVPDAASTLSLLALGLASLIGFRRKIA